jgi:glycosyltransferase involved in cell wall biosynthesis
VEIARSLYICYFGVRQPLVQTQVIPYLRELVKGGHEMELLTFEPEEPREWESEVREGLRADGITWHHLCYHKRPSVPATMFDIANGARHIRKLARETSFDILHCRSHVPTMMAAIARKGMTARPKLLFDIRGFFPEEYVDAGVWPEGGSIYRGVKRAEAWLMKEADGFVVLTDAARQIISREVGDRPLEVIPCCVDLGRFESANELTRREYRERLNIRDRFTLAYVGAFGGWYLTQETADVFQVAKRERPDTFALILTQSDPEMIEPQLRKAGYGPGDIFISKVPAFEIPNYLCAADAAVSFIKNCYSKKASSPTKNAEYLACGLPIVTNSGIGDTDEQINQDGTGVVVNGFDDGTLQAAVSELHTLVHDETTADRCRRSAEERFDLAAVGGIRYRSIYEKLMGVR